MRNFVTRHILTAMTQKLTTENVRLKEKTIMEIIVQKIVVGRIKRHNPTTQEETIILHILEKL